MSARTLLEVLLKFWGVVAFASMLTSIPTVFYLLPSSTTGVTPAQTISVVAGLVVRGLVAIGLLLFARPLSNRLMPGADTGGLEWPAGNLLETSLLALGVFFMVRGLTFLAVVGAELLSAPTWVRAGLQESAWANQRAKFVSAVTELLAGYLVLRFRRRLPHWLPGGAEGAA